MKVLFKSVVLTAVFGAAMGMSAPSSAVGRYITSNSIDKCQAFTPGPANTIRNRVSGAENVGAAPIAIACSFELDERSGGSSVSVSTIELDFHNNGAAAADVACTLLPGTYGNFGAAVAQNTNVVAGGDGSISFGGLALNVFAVGVNCNLPAGMVLGRSRISYTNDDP